MTTKVASGSLGSVLVIGGCGFIGFHIVSLLSSDPDCSTVSVVSRNPAQNRLDGVSYYTGDINSSDDIRKLLADVKPQVIFNTASPRAVDAANTYEDHHRVSVNGTKNLLACAAAAPSVKALVYTSTAAIAKGLQHFNIDETAPLWDQTSKAIPYFKAKALADTLVREANTPPGHSGKSLRTATLRLPMVYGERDGQYIPGQLKALQAGQTGMQLGDGKNLCEPVYVGNVATAHVLAAKALLASTTSTADSSRPKVDGEAFLISDGDPQPFWDFSRRTWRHAGDTTEPESIKVIPAWLALFMAGALEWAFFIFTLGQVKPPLNISRLYIRYAVYNFTYNIDKAKTRLGYRPVVDHDGHLKRSIAWELENHGEKYEGLKVV
ncbi:hypothetical protein MMC20_007911 [Loxospora ochrophaea]|nr:hypothetical protein [Loxospora ochrophaea]